MPSRYDKERQRVLRVIYLCHAIHRLRKIEDLARDELRDG